MAKRTRQSRAGGSTRRVRIIGGQWRGRLVQFADADGLRPSGDRIRETLFNWLQYDIAGSCCLDLFAGSGVLGLEARSRGAESVVLIDSNPAVVRMLKEQVAAFNDTAVSVVQADAMETVRETGNTLPSVSGPFDIVFVDPPFAAGVEAQVVSNLTKSMLVQQDSLIYLETARDLRLSDDCLQHLKLTKSGTAGSVRYQLFQVDYR